MNPYASATNQCILPLEPGKDVIGLAQTGSGKTGAVSTGRVDDLLTSTRVLAASGFWKLFNFELSSNLSGRGHINYTARK